MATGDSADIVQRLKGLLPTWWGAATPVLDALLAGVATGFVYIYDGITYTRLQTRRKTATGAHLDMMGWDFFGQRFRRRALESDDAWRQRILDEIRRPRSTRPAILQHVQDVTGRPAVMYEFTNPFDMGSYRGPYIGYSVAGKYGSILAHTQALLDAYRPATTGVPEVPGYGALTTAAGHFLAGYGITGNYARMADIVGEVTDADIYAAVAETQAAGVTVWTRILSGQPYLEATLNPSDTSAGIVLSLDKLTATRLASPAGTQYSRTIYPLSSGLYGFKCSIGGVGDQGVGLSKAGFNGTYLGSGSGLDSTGYYQSGYASFSDSGGGWNASFPAFADGAVIWVVVNLTTGFIWYRKDTGNWNNDVAANPATGVGGKPISSGSWFPTVALGTGAGASVTIDLDPAGLPVGVATWASAAPLVVQ